MFGAGGYAGALAARLIDRHPWFELAAVTARSDAGRRLDDLYPRHRVPLVLEELDVERHGDVDAALVAYPHGAAAPLVADAAPPGRARGRPVGRLSPPRPRCATSRWYGAHGAPELLGGAAYGLPELHRDEVAGADLVAVPGCYPTATLLALAPLARAGAIADVVVDAKSGVSGAGREATQVTHFVSADENVNPYGVDGHRHSAEIDQELAALGADVTATFMPHLVPLDQGELVSCYVTPRREMRRGRAERAVRGRVRRRAVRGAGRLARPGCATCATPTSPASACTSTRAAAACWSFAAIDNLWKGAASQAVQNLNLMFGRDEGEGIS